MIYIIPNLERFKLQIENETLDRILNCLHLKSTWIKELILVNMIIICK